MTYYFYKTLVDKEVIAFEVIFFKIAITVSLNGFPTKYMLFSRKYPLF